MRLLILCLVLLLVPGLAAIPAAAEEPDQEMENGEEAENEEPVFEINGDAALLMEANSGTVIWEMNSDERLFPASLTKIMSLLIVMEHLEKGLVDLEDRVTVSDRASSMGGSELFLSGGDVVSLENLVIGMAVGSANDAAVAVAEHIAGSVEGFVDLMNKKARELGMTGTNFCNPHGLHDPNHYSTARDIAQMSLALLEYPRIHRYVTIWMDEHFLQGEIRSGEVFLSNTNRMVRDYQGCDGLKTGFTREAGNGISATARRGQTRFLAVVLGCPTEEDRYSAARTLLDYGFAHYKSVPIVGKGELVAVVPADKGSPPQVHLVTGARLGLFLARDDSEEYILETRVDQFALPLVAGEEVGELAACFGESEEIAVPLLVRDPVARATQWQLFRRLAARWLHFGR